MDKDVYFFGKILKDLVKKSSIYKYMLIHIFYKGTQDSYLLRCYKHTHSHSEKMSRIFNKNEHFLICYNFFVSILN